MRHVAVAIARNKRTRITLTLTLALSHRGRGDKTTPAGQKKEWARGPMEGWLEAVELDGGVAEDFPSVFLG